MTWGISKGLAAPVQFGNRSADIDAVRVVGIVAIVAGHIWTVGPFSDFLYAWHVPVFFLLTGYLWKPGRTVRGEMSRRARTLIVPYALWLIIIAVAYCGSLLVDGKPFPSEQIRNALYGGSFAVRPFSAFWFVTVLFFVAVIYRALETTPVWVPWAVAAAGILGAHAFGPAMAKSPLSLALAFPCLTFLLAGTELRRLIPYITKPLAVGLLLTLLGTVLAITGVVAPVDMKGGDFGTPIASVVNAVAISFGLILVARGTVPMLSAAWQKALTALALVGFVVVLSHAFFLFVLDTPPTGGWIDLPVAIIVPWMVALGLARTRLRRWLIG
ncbi:acyltransferase family protein [Arthrobacter sp. CC3]|uniref:acyltransferase family protein n=1 Tax=Arthrobacter sp. CC3 TaxID=3029185 RepID=UPI00326664C7